MRLKVPPPIQFLVSALAMWGIARLATDLSIQFPYKRWIIFVLALPALGLSLIAIFSFLKAKTTIHPHDPNLTSSLVTDGVYQWSRNPMYLALALLLLAWGVGLGNLISFLVWPVFIWYISNFQIIPEEEILTQKYGDDYLTYCRKVRRWV